MGKLTEIGVENESAITERYASRKCMKRLAIGKRYHLLSASETRWCYAVLLVCIRLKLFVPLFLSVWIAVKFEQSNKEKTQPIDVVKTLLQQTCSEWLYERSFEPLIKQWAEQLAAMHTSADRIQVNTRHLGYVRTTALRRMLEWWHLKCRSPSKVQRP